MNVSCCTPKRNSLDQNLCTYFKASKATLCNLPCKKKFYVVLHSKTGKGWGAGQLTINALVSGMQLSLPVTVTPADTYEKRTTVCVRSTTLCYSAELSEGRGAANDMSFEISDDSGTISIAHTGPGSYTFGSNTGCPGRNLKRMGRYTLSQVQRLKLNEINGKKMMRNVQRRSASLGIEVLPLQKMGAFVNLLNETNPEEKKKNKNKRVSDYCDPPKGTPNMKWFVFVS